MKDLLDKIRGLNNQLQNTSGKAVQYEAIARMLSKVIGTNVGIVGRTGNVLGFGLLDEFPCPPFTGYAQENTMLPEQMQELLMQHQKSELLVLQGKAACALDKTGAACIYEERTMAMVPILAGGQRQGSLILVNCDARGFGDKEAVLAEYGAMVIGLEMLRERSERIEEENRQRNAVQIAMSTLSYSEQEAIEHIFAELGGKEALLVASKIADRVGITRSVIVNALRKLESAGLIETKSLGMKGTYIRILNDSMGDEWEALGRKKSLR